jgi:V/A-type H+-transporting ATPase subunit E
MTLEKIIQIAVKQAQNEIDAMHKSTGKEVLSILDAATREAESLNSEARAWADSEAQRLGVSLISSANLESRKLMLEARTEVLNRVRKGVSDSIKAMPIIERERIIRKLLAKARKHIPEGTVRVREEDMDILKANLGSYRIGPPARISGGIIVDSQDRKKSIDLSFETLFEETWERSFIELTRFLFGEGNE